MIFETVTVPGADLQKLLGAASGDAALLYLYIKAGNDPETAGQALNLNANRLGCAFFAYSLQIVPLLSVEPSFTRIISIFSNV